MPLLSRRQVWTGALAAPLLAACGAQPSTAADVAVLRRTLQSDVDTLDPHKASGFWERMVLGDLYTGLFTEAADGTPTPGAAGAHEVAADGLSWRFTLRPHDWSDGTPVTAEDFVFALRRLMTPATAAPYASILSILAGSDAVLAGAAAPETLGVAAEGPHGLRLELTRPAPFLPELLTHFVAYPLPRHRVLADPTGWTKPGGASNGPYVLTRRIAGDRLELAANPRFFEAGSVGVPAVAYLPRTDTAAAVTGFRAGEIDIVAGVPSNQVATLKRQYAAELFVTPSMMVVYVVFNLRRPPLAARAVRQALTAAIDRTAIAGTVLNADDAPTGRLTPEFLSGRATAAPAADAAQARALLRESAQGGVPTPAIALSHAALPDTRKIAVAIQDMWGGVGVATNLRAADPQTHYAALRSGDFDAAIAVWNPDYADPEAYLYLGEAAGNQANYGGYDSPAFNDLMRRAQAAGPQARIALLAEAEDALLGDAALAPLYFAAARNLVARRVQGWVPNPRNLNRSRYLKLAR